MEGTMTIANGRLVALLIGLAVAVGAASVARADSFLGERQQSVPVQQPVQQDGGKVTTQQGSPRC